MDRANLIEPEGGTTDPPRRSNHYVGGRKQGGLDNTTTVASLKKDSGQPLGHKELEADENYFTNITAHDTL